MVMVAGRGEFAPGTRAGGFYRRKLEGWRRDSELARAARDWLYAVTGSRDFSGATRRDASCGRYVKHPPYPLPRTSSSPHPGTPTCCAAPQRSVARLPKMHALCLSMKANAGIFWAA